MDAVSEWPEAEVRTLQTPSARSRWPWVAGLGVVVLVGVAWFGPWERGTESTAQAAMPPAPVTVSRPLARDVDTQVGFLEIGRAHV